MKTVMPLIIILVLWLLTACLFVYCLFNPLISDDLKTYDDHSLTILVFIVLCFYSVSLRNILIQYK